MIEVQRVKLLPKEVSTFPGDCQGPSSRALDQGVASLHKPGYFGIRLSYPLVEIPSPR